MTSTSFPWMCRSHAPARSTRERKREDGAWDIMDRGTAKLAAELANLAIPSPLLEFIILRAGFGLCMGFVSQSNEFIAGPERLRSLHYNGKNGKA